jgi:hypothetical protein
MAQQKKLPVSYCSDLVRWVKKGEKKRELKLPRFSRLQPCTAATTHGQQQAVSNFLHHSLDIHVTAWAELYRHEGDRA